MKVFDLGFLEIPLPIRVLDSAFETFSTVATTKKRRDYGASSEGFARFESQRHPSGRVALR